VQPSPTMITHRRIKAATKAGVPILLTGVTMGGGPSHWAAEAHLEAGLPLYATPDAARSFNDDLDFVREFGVTVVSEDEAAPLGDDVVRLELKDFDYDAIEQAFLNFDISLKDLDVVAAAVFDHGAAPPGYSDRQFRFDYIEERVTANPKLSEFAFLREEIPGIMTRMKAVSASASSLDLPLVLMDTAPAAVLGAMQDPAIRQTEQFMMTNVGNFHTIAFRMLQGKIEGVFEHHTGMLDTEKLDRLMGKLADGTLMHEEIFNDHGHGALLLSPDPLTLSDRTFGVAVTGPRWAMMRGSKLRPHFSTPFGDMMMAGCYGLVEAVGYVLPEYREEISAALDEGREKPPWELD
ncbi:MAG: DUF1786 domain-containing protein, partial [Anaerolineales bacterium]